MFRACTVALAICSINEMKVKIRKPRDFGGRRTAFPGEGVLSGSCCGALYVDLWKKQLQSSKNRREISMDFNFFPNFTLSKANH